MKPALGNEADVAFNCQYNLQGVSLSVLHYSLHKSKVASIFADEMRLGEAR